jgi:hypothetical protein
LKKWSISIFELLLMGGVENVQLLITFLQHPWLRGTRFSSGLVEWEWRAIPNVEGEIRLKIREKSMYFDIYFEGELVQLLKIIFLETSYLDGFRF